jgi:carbamoyl-phosphate synthase large subunit
VKLEIYGADITNLAPALFFCDYTVIVPRIKDVDYIPTLQRICKEEQIDALIPTIDTDLLLLAEHKHDFGNTKVVISESDKVKLCRDKRFTADYFNSVGLLSPHPVDDWIMYDAGYPAFIKPKDGSSSVFAYKVENESELKSFAQQVPDYIIQPFIEGTEYTIDIFCDFNGNPIFITPRIRLAVRAGEVLKTEIVQDNKIIEEMKQLVADYKPCGQITVQMIREKATGDDYYIEINPRFGGGSPLSMKAGADSAEALIRLIAGEELKFMDKAAEDGALFSRFDQSVRLK